jgi:hypothetical protein
VTAYVPPAGSIYADIPGAGNNTSVHDTDYARGLVARLDQYERAWIDYEHSHKQAQESELHRRAMTAAGLTEGGLCTARAYAGKKASWKPGVFYRIADYRPVS